MTGTSRGTGLRLRDKDRRARITGLVGSQRKIARSRFQPHVEDVGFFFELGAAAVRTLNPGRKNRIGFRSEPCVGARASEQFDDPAIDLAIIQRLAAGFAQKDSDGHAPHALPRNAPIRPGGDHVRKSFLAPAGIPFHALDFFQSSVTQRVFARSPAGHRSFHRDEPLLRRAKNHRIMAAPAMRIGMLRLLRMQQRAAALQQFDDRLVRFPHAFACHTPPGRCA